MERLTERMSDEMNGVWVKEHDYISAAHRLADYGYGAPLYGWHISDLVAYDEPKKMDDFTGLRETKFGLKPVTIKRPPQSWCYVKEVE